MLDVLNTMGLTLNSTPLKDRLVGRQRYEACILPPGEFTNMGFCMAHNDMLWFLTNACDMNECEAPESKRTVAGVEFTLNVPSMTYGSTTAVSVDT